MTAYLSGDGSLSALLQLKVDAAYVPSKSISQLIHAWLCVHISVNEHYARLDVA